jgi:hypothetical protein
MIRYARLSHSSNSTVSAFMFHTILSTFFARRGYLDVGINVDALYIIVLTTLWFFLVEVERHHWQSTFSLVLTLGDSLGVFAYHYCLEGTGHIDGP